MPAGKDPIPDSVEITKYLAAYYPAMIPHYRENEIYHLLEGLHRISYFGLTFAGNPEILTTWRDSLEKTLKGDFISERYRKALQAKIRWCAINPATFSGNIALRRWSSLDADM